MQPDKELKPGGTKDPGHFFCPFQAGHCRQSCRFFRRRQTNDLAGYCALAELAHREVNRLESADKMCFFKARLVVVRWNKQDKPVVGPKRIKLTAGVFHGGSTFRADIHLDEEEGDELTRAMKDGYRLEMYVIPEK